MRHAAFVLVVLFAISPAHALVLCARPKGDGTVSASLKVREVCKPSEMQLDPVALGLQGPQGMPGPGLVVKDANGALVGALLGPDPRLGQFVTVVRRVGDATIYLIATSEGILERGQVWFESSDCTGAPLYLIDWGFTDGTPPQVALADEAQVIGGLLYYPSGSITERRVRSRLLVVSAGSEGQSACSAVQGAFTPPNLCCEPWDETVKMRPAASVGLGSLGLVPPFHVEGP